MRATLPELRGWITIHTLRDVLAQTATLHAKQRLHRDLKVENIMHTRRALKPIHHVFANDATAASASAGCQRLMARQPRVGLLSIY